MLTAPLVFLSLLTPFARSFRRTTWAKAQVLLTGALLAPGRRTVTAALRAAGQAHTAGFARYHHVLSRARWSARDLSRILLGLLLHHLDAGEGPLVFGLDETLERRRGARIAGLGIYRDAVRSSASHFVKASGLRWVCLCWLGRVRWAQRVWALPFLTALAPSERYYRKRGRTPKKLTGWARQLILQLRRWLPGRRLVVVADSSYAVLDLLHACQTLPRPVTMITRLRLDAALYEPAPPRRPGQVGRPRRKGKRLPSLQQRLQDPATQWTCATVAWYDGACRTLELASGSAVWYHGGLPTVPLRWVLVRDPHGQMEPQALLSTEAAWTAPQIVEWFVLRWQMEVTFQEARSHLGVETQRQWSDQAVARTTPLLLGLFSWVALAATVLQQCPELTEGEHQSLTTRTASWYRKPLPTFSDALALVRRSFWNSHGTFAMSHGEADTLKVPRAFIDHLVDTLAYAA